MFGTPVNYLQILILSKHAKFNNTEEEMCRYQTCQPLKKHPAGAVRNPEVVRPQHHTTASMAEAGQHKTPQPLEVWLSPHPRKSQIQHEHVVYTQHE